MDKRQQPRWAPPADQQIEIQIMGLAADFVDVLTARDISSNGIGIYIPEYLSEIQEDTFVDLIVTLPGREPFEVQGVVVHDTSREERFFGVRFLGLSPSAAEVIADYLQQEDGGEVG